MQQSKRDPNIEKHYNPFTEDDERRIDLQKLLTDTRYQLDVVNMFGMDVLAELLKKARAVPASE